MTVINEVIESVMELIDGLNLFAPIYRGALGTGDGLCCEIATTYPEAVFLDKNKYIPIDLTINGKHENLKTLSDDMNAIHQDLTMLRSYPSDEYWKIVDITTITEPQVIGREDGNQWVMASSLSVKVETKL